MPELPEVATIASQLNEVMPFRIKSFVRSSVSDSIIHTKMDRLKGKVILEVGRKGKMLDFLLSDQRHLLCHLGMTGGWRISRKKVLEKHTHLQFCGESAQGEEFYLAYVDPRRFGHMYLYEQADAEKKLAELGVDLKSPAFTFHYFKNALLKYPERFVKVSLLDQSLFAGTGNYIANEICARAKVLPQRIVKSLSEAEIKRLYHNVAIVVEGAMATGGTTFQGGYADTTGSRGGGVTHLVVFYQKICQMCLKTPVAKITLGQRGTYYCPKCQK
jgi:formamidopyrimidine-DNA glycosylase